MSKKTDTTVTLFCALPSGICFDLPGGRRLTVHGVNSLVGGKPVLTSGRYAVTPDVPAADWEWVKKTYGQCAYLQATPPQLYAGAAKQGAEQAAEQSPDVTTGMEQIDVNQPQTTQTTPDKGKAGA